MQKKSLKELVFLEATARKKFSALLLSRNPRKPPVLEEHGSPNAQTADNAGGDALIVE